MTRSILFLSTAALAVALAACAPEAPDPEPVAAPAAEPASEALPGSETAVTEQPTQASEESGAFNLPKTKYSVTPALWFLFAGLPIPPATVPAA